MPLSTSYMPLSCMQDTHCMSLPDPTVPLYAGHGLASMKGTLNLTPTAIGQKRLKEYPVQFTKVRFTFTGY